jgi:hypothetical protein
MSRNSEFSIEVIPHPPSEPLSPQGPEARGRITVGAFSETFRMDLSFWGVHEYRRSWSRALKRLDNQESIDSCLISSITDPVVSNFILCWPIYRRGEDVFVQNSLIFLDEISGQFNAEEPWLHIGPHHTVNEDGVRISEWRTGISEVLRFMRDDLED